MFVKIKKKKKVQWPMPFQRHLFLSLAFKINAVNLIRTLIFSFTDFDFQ